MISIVFMRFPVIPATPAPTFTNGKSEALSNGVDYLVVACPASDVTSSQVNIPITYQHVATRS